MTRDEFLKLLDAELKLRFSDRDREPSMWYLLLEEWAERCYNEAYRAEKAARQVTA